MAGRGDDERKAKPPAKRPAKKTAAKKATAKKVPAKESAAKAPATKPLHIDTHRGLIGNRRKIIATMSAKPESLALLALNPVLAFKDAGVTFSAEMADHVLRTVQFAPAERAEHDELVAMLREELGVIPRPLDASWLAETVFSRLEVPPLDTSDVAPAYRNPIPDDALERLRALLPSRRAGRRVATVSSQVPLVKVPDSVLHLDLDASVPALPPAREAPKELTLEDLWFYLDSHALIRPLLRLGIIERGGLRILTPDAFRKVKSGAASNQLLTWITDVRFPADGR